MGANEIVPNLYVGDWNDAMVFQGECLCVLENAPRYNNMTHYVAILQGCEGHRLPRPVVQDRQSWLEKAP